MAPFLLLFAGALALLAALLLLLSFGEAFRVARLLQTTRRVSLDEAVELARRAPPAPATGTGAPSRGAHEAPYVRVSGRIDADDAFPDEHRRPLVFRRTRIEVREGRAWRTLDERRERVPFQLQAGLAAVGVRDAELNGGLVVVPRQASGTAGEAPDALPARLPASARVRIRIDQLSAVDHATVLGVPRLGPDGEPEIGAGARRPLVLTNLEDAEAMRILAAGSPRRPLVIVGLLVAGTALVALGIAAIALRLAGAA